MYPPRHQIGGPRQTPSLPPSVKICRPYHKNVHMSLFLWTDFCKWMGICLSLRCDEKSSQNVGELKMCVGWAGRWYFWSRGLWGWVWRCVWANSDYNEYSWVRTCRQGSWLLRSHHKMVSSFNSIQMLFMLKCQFNLSKTQQATHLTLSPSL